jgi:tetratricopeptide (TPR) repeat protein
MPGATRIFRSRNPAPVASGRPVRMRGAILPGLAGLGLLLSLALLFGCTAKREIPEQRAASAQALFDRATREFHVPSAAATGAEKLKLQEQAVAAYQELLKQHADLPRWAAPALRSLGNIRAAQTNLDEAVKLYAAVAQRYPEQEWEVCMALKSAADLLWETGRRDEARPFYEKIVARFDRPDAAPVVRTVVKGSQAKLAGGASGR